MAGQNGKSTREQMVQALAELITPQTQTGADVLKIRGAIQGAKQASASVYFQQEPLSASFFQGLYGSPASFLEEYEKFIQKYFTALDNKANHAKGTTVNVELMKKRGRIDLKVFNKEKSDELYETYTREILKLDKLIAQGGLPGVELPSSNLYSTPYKYITRAEPDGTMHPVQVLLGRSYISFKKGKSGMDSFTVSKNNILSRKVLEELTNQSANTKGPLSGLVKDMVVATLDTETTGVFDDSQVRSMSIVQSKVGADGGLVDHKTVYNAFFDSPQLSGYTIGQLNGGSVPLARFLAGSEGDGSELLSMNKFLDESEQFIKTLLASDRIAGHNIYFDIDKMIQTMSQTPGFGTHTVKDSLQKLVDRIDQGDYLIDTLESTRSYLDKQVLEAIETAKIAGVEEKSLAYVRGLFSEDILARVHVGGSASGYSMENIALNTNLFELIERDGQAESLFELIKKGSHISETDDYLQAYVANYIQSGELKIWPLAQEMVINKKKQLKTAFGTYGRSQILKSQAITPTTNLADIQMISDNVYKYLMTEEGARDVSVSIANAGETFGIKSLEGQTGVLTRKGSDFGVLTREGFEPVDKKRALDHIIQTLQSARQAASDSALLTPLQVGRSVEMVNAANSSINDLGFSVGAASRANQLANIGLINISTEVTDDAIRNAFGSVYRAYGSGISDQDQLYGGYGLSPRDSVFQAGLGKFSDNVPVDIAKKFAAIGDPLYFMDAQSRVVSTMLAETTASTGVMANRVTRAARKSGESVADIAFSGSPKLMSELGISYFKAQEEASMFMAASREFGTSKIVAPTKLVEKAFSGLTDDAFKNVGLSVMDVGKGPRVNLVLNVSQQSGGNRDQVRAMMKNLFDLMSDDQSVAKELDTDLQSLHRSISTEVQFYQKTKLRGQAAIDEAIDLATDIAMERGVVIGYTEGEEAEKIIQNLRRMGFDISNDVNIRNLTSRVLRTGLSDKFLALAPFMFDDGLKISGVTRAADDAFRMVPDGKGGNVTPFVKSANEIAERLQSNRQLRREVSREVKLSKAADGDRVLTEFYLKNKSKIGIGLGLTAIAGFGYYRAKKNREQNLYDEAVEKMPYQSSQEIDLLAELRQNYNFTPQMLDPLATAGVVGNLDRSKIGHYQMGNNKYDHLFGR